MSGGVLKAGMAAAEPLQPQAPRSASYGAAAHNIATESFVERAPSIAIETRLEQQPPSASSTKQLAAVDADGGVAVGHHREDKPHGRTSTAC